MKRLLLTATAYCLATANCFAVGPTYRNTPLGFEVRIDPKSDNILVCSQDTCLTFVPSADGNSFTEESGKCTLTMEHFTKNFATGNTKNEFMLTVTVQVIKVIKGEDACQLEQASPKQMRSLTGIYNVDG